MTEAEWLGCEDPTPMLAFLRRKAGARKMRLFACACCRRFWELAPDVCRGLIELAERYADKRYTGDRITQREATEALNAAQKCARGQLPGPKCAFVAADRLLRFQMEGGAAVWAARAVLNDARDELAETARVAERAVQAALMRDVVGNPLNPASIDSAWLTSTVVALAQGIYAERAFDRMPILADALQDAGCDNNTILEHCRGSGPHCRGCWVVDLILGKS
jgi:hypothetical protein